ncbi:uncharacterized protein LOC130739896 [Lotus japonicus]|uniref:uncharacterized protein LOC130739896 n=1 Tax=Lotus japonicus TaxID=34305 RepID=UPI0025851BC2|nr:uncharacterized protein LOC130739896 [Lotus japonicus]
MVARDYYKILKVNRDATDEELKNAYKRLTMQCHPDNNHHQCPLRKQEFEAKFNKITEAYAVLSDPKKRQIYDLYGHYPINLKKSGDGDVGNNLNEDEDSGVVVIRLECTLVELYKGCRKKLKILRTVLDEFGNLKTVEEILKIDVKPGWKKGTKITFPGKGNVEPGATAADLIFVVDERPHGIFKRYGNDLVVTQKILLLDALVGTTLNLTALDGRDITFEVTDIVKPGYEMVVPNEGMPLSKDPSKKGNLIFKFDVMFPSRLTTQQEHDLKRILSDADR